MDMNHLIDAGFCELQQKKIGELNSQLFIQPGCSFNVVENRCVTKELDKKISEKYYIENRINELDENIKSLEEDREKEPIDKTLDTLKFIIESTNQLQQRLFQNVEKDAVEEKKQEIDPEHEILYKKIDLYMEKISKLENVEKYNLLDILISKYGRDAIPTNDPPENETNIYCKYGNKVLCCACDKRMVELFKSDDDFDQGLKTLVDDLVLRKMECIGVKIVVEKFILLNMKLWRALIKMGQEMLHMKFLKAMKMSLAVVQKIANCLIV